MWRLINLTLVLLCLFGRASLFGLDSIQTQEIQAQKSVQPEWSKPKPVLDQPLSCNDRTTPAFWDSLSHLPVQFINMRKESRTLIGQFASPNVLSIKQIEFKLGPENKEEKKFFQINGEWEEEINQKVFLKKFKNDFWAVSYLTINKENVICEAHQFKDWRSLEVSYAQGSKNLNVKTVEFWNNLKSVPISFYEIRHDKAFWIFLLYLGNIPVPEEPITLENGKLVNKYQRFNDGSYGVILDHDVFTIDKNCIFHVIEKKDPRLIKIPKSNMAQFALGGHKIRAKPVDRDYFVKNAPQNFWLCFYEKDFENRALVLLRAMGISLDEENSKKNGNGKNQNGKNGNKFKK